MESIKNTRLLLFFSVLLVSMILITSQTPEVFAGVGKHHDADGDGFSPKEGDCDDNDPEVYPVNGICAKQIENDVKDGIVVGSNETVIISNGATVDGDLKVNGGTVIITGSSTIKGNLESNGGTISIEEGSVIEGNVNIIVSGASGVLEIDGAEIKGNLETNGIGTLTVTDSNINGNIYSENDIDVTITGNTVNGNLEILGPSSCSESSNDVNGNNSGCT